MQLLTKRCSLFVSLSVEDDGYWCRLCCGCSHPPHRRHHTKAGPLCCCQSSVHSSSLPPSLHQLTHQRKVWYWSPQMDTIISHPKIISLKLHQEWRKAWCDIGKLEKKRGPTETHNKIFLTWITFIIPFPSQPSSLNCEGLFDSFMQEGVKQEALL